MIRYITHENINKSKWDICVDEAFNGLIYAKSWYLDIVADNWDALVENNYEKIFPLVYRKKYGILYLHQPVFTQQLGLFSKTLLTGEGLAAFLEAIPEKFRFAEINLNTLNKVISGSWTKSDWITYELDLIKPHDQLRRNYSSNLKRNLKKAESAKLNMVKSIKPDDVIRLFRENRGRRITGLQTHDYMRLSRLAYSGIYKGVVTTYGVYDHSNTLCAGAIFLHSKRKSIFLFSGLNDMGKQTGAMAFLIDSFINEHQQKHLTLDFEGSNDPNLARFYKSFGASKVTYPHLRISRLSPALSFLVNTAKNFRSGIRWLKRTFSAR